jgi:hypothetical protein
MGSGGGSSATDTTSSGSDKLVSGRNAWDFATVLAVLVFLAVVTIYLAHRYTSVNSAATILGIISPVLGAVFGVTIGYSAGNKSGQAQGESAAKTKIKNDLQPTLDELASTMHEQVPVEHHSALSPSVEGARAYLRAL